MLCFFVLAVESHRHPCRVDGCCCLHHTGPRGLCKRNYRSRRAYGSGGICTQGAVHTYTLPVARGEKGTPWRVHQREHSGTGWADAGGGKGRLNFLYSSLEHSLTRLTSLPKFRHHDICTVRPGGEQHALADAKAHLAGLQIGHHDHLLADQVLRTIRLPDTGENGALLTANIYPQAQQLSGTFYRF